MAAGSHVYRALRIDEVDSEGDLICKDSLSATSISDTIEQGTPSKYVHCTKNRYVALWFAEEHPNVPNKQVGRSAHKIVCIDLSKIKNRLVLEPTAEKGLTQRAAQLARKQQVILVEMVVPRSSIVAEFCTLKWSSKLGNERGIDSFINFLPMRISLDLDKWAQHLVPPVVANDWETTQAKFELDPIASGRFKAVHRGRYTSGPRVGHPVVVKFAKASSYVGDEIFWQEDIKSTEKAADIVKAFNEEMKQRFRNPPHVLLARATVWRKLADNCKHLVEPFINSHFQKFNSNTGYESDDQLCKALSHFSYHHSWGTLLLCDLKGGYWQSQNAHHKQTLYYVLTDPVLMSTTPRTYGAADLGQDGIDSFMHHHKCGNYCDKSWHTCDTSSSVFVRKKGSSVMTSCGVLLGTKYVAGKSCRRNIAEVPVRQVYEEGDENFFYF